MAPKRMTALELWGKEFARVREEAGLSQTALAEAAYISPSLIGMWETGKRTLKHEDLARCEERMGTNGRLAWSLKSWVPREIPHEWLDKLDLHRRTAEPTALLRNHRRDRSSADSGLCSRRSARRRVGQPSARTHSQNVTHPEPSLQIDLKTAIG